MGMRVRFPSPRPSPGGRGSINKNPALLRGAGHQSTLLWLTDFQDFNIICAAGRLDFDSIANLMVQNRLTNGGLV